MHVASIKDKSKFLLACTLCHYYCEGSGRRGKRRGEERTPSCTAWDFVTYPPLPGHPYPLYHLSLHFSVRVSHFASSIRLPWILGAVDMSVTCVFGVAGRKEGRQARVRERGEEVDNGGRGYWSLRRRGAGLYTGQTRSTTPSLPPSVFSSSDVNLFPRSLCFSKLVLHYRVCVVVGGGWVGRGWEM